MRLHDLLNSISRQLPLQAGNPEITFLTCDSRQVKPGTLFFALRGATVDGHRFIPAAIEAGAAAIVQEEPASSSTNIPLIVVEDARNAMAHIAAAFNGNPTSTRPLIGITGTNGKTTTTYLIEGILRAAGMQPAVLGTISYRFGSTRIEASHTTPESTELQGAFRKLAESGAQSYIMEVSSHSLEQKRVDGCHFDVGIFSNLTRDHLDYHGDMESYLSAKNRLFTKLLQPDSLKPFRRGVINMDDSYGARIAATAACPVITFGIAGEWDVHPKEVALTVHGISGLLATPKGEFQFASRLLGRFNLYNILAAVSAGIALDLPLPTIRDGIENHTVVPGRMERVENSHGVICLVDYAHTGDALENALTTIQEIAQRRIITVFGCGGDRDNGKRPIMGKIAVQLSDLAIVTSDNPRTEDPEKILEQIKAGITDVPPTLQGECRAELLREYQTHELVDGFSDKGFVVMENRHEAIHLAIRLARPGDIVLLAGKGHEDYQIIGTTKHHFDDREEAALAFAEKDA